MTSNRPTDDPLIEGDLEDREDLSNYDIDDTIRRQEQQDLDYEKIRALERKALPFPEEQAPLAAERQESPAKKHPAKGKAKTPPPNTPGPRHHYSTRGAATAGLYGPLYTNSDLGIPPAASKAQPPPAPPSDAPAENTTSETNKRPRSPEPPRDNSEKKEQIAKHQAFKNPLDETKPLKKVPTRENSPVGLPGILKPSKGQNLFDLDQSFRDEIDLSGTPTQTRNGYGSSFIGPASVSSSAQIIEFTNDYKMVSSTLAHMSAQIDNLNTRQTQIETLVDEQLRYIRHQTEKTTLLDTSGSPATTASTSTGEINRPVVLVPDLGDPATTAGTTADKEEASKLFAHMLSKKWQKRG